MGSGYSMIARGKASADIYIYEDVGGGWFGGVSAKDFAADLKKMGAVETINLHINSNGGLVFEGMAIYRQLVEHPARIVTHVDGVAASIASVIAMAGDEILISEGGFIMIHNASVVANGDARELRRIADTLDTVTAATADVYVSRTGIGREDVLALMDVETWMTAQDAVDRGFATRIVENLRLTAHAIDPAKHNFTKIPEALKARPAIEAAQERLRAMRAKLQRHKLRAA